MKEQTQKKCPKDVKHSWTHLFQTSYKYIYFGVHVLWGSSNVVCVVNTQHASSGYCLGFYLLFIMKEGSQTHLKAAAALLVQINTVDTFGVLPYFLSLLHDIRTYDYIYIYIFKYIYIYVYTYIYEYCIYTYMYIYTVYMYTVYTYIQYIYICIKYIYIIYMHIQYI